MAQIKTLTELITPDERTLRFTPLGFSTGGTLKPEYAAKFQQEVIASCELNPDVPEGTRNGFERLRTLHSYGILCYEAFTVADDLAWLVMEQALRERFVTYFNGTIPFVNTKTGVEDSITVQDFDGVYETVRRGGSHAARAWHIKLRSTGELMEFRGSFSHLLKWARQEGLLHGQRNKALEPIYRRIRNRVAHPSYHLKMPPDSARTIHDLAEIINRLWGHPTPGGRLYPAPLDRQVLVVAWTDAEVGTTHMILRDYQLATFHEPGNWMCIVVRAIFEDEGVWEFDARFERTNLPTELLWGPGRPDEALAWMNEAKPEADATDYLDRLFSLRIHEDRASLAMRPETALALPAERRAGRWFIVRADFPNDAFVHVRHIKDGVTCGASDPVVRQLQPGVIATSPPIPHCAVEGVFEGEWDDMVRILASRFKVTEPATLSTVRVRPRFSLGVAPDVEAE
jgi:hypothetical protein